MENPSFLDHDSFVELRALFRIAPSDFERASRAPSGNPIGRVSAVEAGELAFAAKRAITLTEEQQEIIWTQLVTTWRD